MSVRPLPTRDGRMDADTRAFLKRQPKPSRLTPTPATVKEQMRRARLVSQPDLPHVDQARDYEAAGPCGPVPVRIYRGAGTADARALPALVYCHGGGWMAGDLDGYDWICRSIANAAQCAVISVDYRTAPEHAFPAAVDDAFSATCWLLANAGRLRVDPARVSIGGEGAGGNLAAAVALTLRDGGQVRLRTQILLYPAVDLCLGGPAHGRFSDVLLLTDDTLRAFIDHYVPDAAQRRDWRASPLFAPSLRGLPPTLLLLAGLDPLCGQGELFAERLERDGVPTTVKRYPGQLHGFMYHAKVLRKAYDAIDDVAAMLKANH